MAERDPAAARKILQVAEAETQSADDDSRLTRAKAMAGNLGVFWTSIRRELPGFEAGSELELPDARVAIVESSADELVVKDAGRLKRYTITTMPTVVVVALAEQRFVSDANWKMLLGTFLAVDPEGNRARARQLWREATKGGVNTDDLLPELETPD